ncbi:MAG TPA: DNA polymerase [Chloroflexi bacterium]|nr:DNA polymerase [Chloroflexota bacterium]|tara:strand:+ start:1205 stop:1588 length:384 start_codon:yes stop_codon:yes gene_type:complete
MADLKDWLNSINLTKEDITRDDPQLIKKYSPFIINKCMSGHLDTVMFANEMNLQSHLAKDLQYQFYLNSIRKKKRFSPWLRKDKIKNLDVVKSYYGYSNEKAIQALKILSKEQLNYIKAKIDVGGTT